MQKDTGALFPRALAFERLANIYRQLGGKAASPGDFAAQALDLLLRTDPKVLQKYMGREQAHAFIGYPREQPRILVDTHAAS